MTRGINWFYRAASLLLIIGAVINIVCSCQGFIISDFLYHGAVFVSMLVYLVIGLYIFVVREKNVVFYILLGAVLIVNLAVIVFLIQIFIESATYDVATSIGTLIFGILNIIVVIQSVVLIVSFIVNDKINYKKIAYIIPVVIIVVFAIIGVVVSLGVGMLSFSDNISFESLISLLYLLSISIPFNISAILLIVGDWKDNREYSNEVVE
jgi:hypothetical protein